MSSGSLVMTGWPRSLAQMATLTSTMSAVRVAAHRAPTRSAILASNGTTDVFDAGGSFAIQFIERASSRFSPQADALKKLHIKAHENGKAAAG